MNTKNANSKNRVKIMRRLGGGVFACMLILIGVAGVANVARADPHAIFYTAIGQQQLFFNVLAALDQADYVETSLAREQKRQAREAVDAEQPFVRESESGARLTVGTELKQDTTGQQSQTVPGEPALVNRPVTLEGADLYTDQLVRQFGAESARRNAAAELLQALCENGFGFDGCDYDIDAQGLTNVDKQRIQVRREDAAIVNPLAWSRLPYNNGVWAALNSSNTARNIDNPHPDNVNPLGGINAVLTDEEYRAGKKLMPDIFGGAPVAYSGEIASWRYFINQKSGADLLGHMDAFNGLLKGVTDAYSPAEPSRYPYQEFLFAQNGEPYLIGLSWAPSDCGNSIPCLNPAAPAWSLAYNPAITGMTVKSYLLAVSDMTSLGKKRVADIASEAAYRIYSQQQLMQDEGVLAKTSLQQHASSILTGGSQPISLSDYGELTVNIDSPVAASEASIYGIPNVLGMLATSQDAGSLEGLDIPGSVQLVKRAGAGSGSQAPECSDGINNDSDSYIDYPNDPECASATDTSELLAGQQSSAGNSGPQVAGALDLLFEGTAASGNFFDQKKRETSPSANIISPILEFGARHALRVLTAGKWRESTAAGPTCGFTCD